MSHPMRTLAIACALALAACEATPPPRPAAAAPSQPPGSAPVSANLQGIAGTRWIAADTSVPEASRPRLEFLAQGRVSGFTGCNMLGGAWSEQGGVVRLGQVMATKRGCMGPEGEIEKRLLPLLGPETRVVREGARLVLTAAGGARFEFTQVP